MRTLAEKIEKVMQQEIGRVRILHNYGSFCDFESDGNFYSVNLTKTGQPKKHSIRRDYRQSH